GDHSRLILRIGGESADSSYWGSTQARFVGPAYRQRRAFHLTEHWMKEVGVLVRAADLRVMFDLDLAAHSPSMAAAEVRALRRHLPGGSLTNFEVGNEPDNYSRAYVGDTRAVPGGPGNWAFSFRMSDYTSMFGVYVRSVRRVFRGA